MNKIITRVRETQSLKYRFFDKFFLFTLFFLITFISGFSQKKVLFDATKAETAANADWVIDADLFNLRYYNTGAVSTGGSEANAQRYPTPAAPTAETDWTGGLSSFGFAVYQMGYIVETLPWNGRITYGDGTNAQDLSNYDVYVICEPNIMFTAAEKSAILAYVNAGGGLFMLADHGGDGVTTFPSDRNNDGNSSLDVFNDLMSGNIFGMYFEPLSYESETTTRIIVDATDPLLHNASVGGDITGHKVNGSAVMTLSTAGNASVKGIIYKTGATLGGSTNCYVAYCTYGAGRVVGMGDSSPAEDVTSDPGDVTYEGWTYPTAPHLGDNGHLILNATVWLAGTTPTLTVFPTSLSGYSYVLGAGPSASQSFSLSGTNLAGTQVTVSGSTNYEVSLDNTTFTSSVNVSYTAPTLAATTIYVRLKAGLTAASYNNENVTCTDNGGSPAATKTVSNSGSVTSGGSSVCLTENFDAGTTDPTGWANNSAYYNTTAARTGNGAGMNAVADWIRTSLISTDPQSITFWVKASSTTANYTVVLETSPDNVSYTTQATYVANGSNTGDVTSTYGQLSATLNLTGTYYIRWSMTVRSGGSFYMDDVEVTCGASSTPTITTSAAPTGFGNQCINSYYGEKTYTVSGSNLTTDIILTPPAGFEISTTSGSGFVSNPSTLTLTQSGGTVPVTTIYVRMYATAVQAYSGNITHTSTGATQANIALSGTGINNAPTVTTPTSANIATTSVTLGATLTDEGCTSVSEEGIYYSTTNGFADGTGTKVSVTAGAPYSADIFTIPVTGLTPNTLYYYKGFATNTIGSGYSSQGSFTTIHNAPNVGSGTGATSSSIAANWTAPTGGGSATFTYTVEVDDDPAFGSVDFTQSGIASGTLTVTATGLAASTTYYFRVKAVNAGGSSAWSSTSVGYATLAPTPVLTVSVSTLTGFMYVEGSGPSANQTYNLSGLYLTGAPGNIVVSAPADYEVCLTSGGTYTASVNVAYSTSTLASTPIYVRLKAGLTNAASPYNSENVSNAGGGATTVNVACSGTVTAVSAFCLEQLNFTSTPAGWAQTNITYATNEANFAATTGELVTLAVANPLILTFDLRRTSNTTAKSLLIEVSTTTQGGAYTTVFTYDHSNTTSGSTTNCSVDLSSYNSSSTVFIKFRKSSGTTSPWYLKNVQLTCGAASPTLTTSLSALTGFTYAETAGPSANQTYTISGSNLTGSGNITVSGSVNYEVSTDGITFAASITYPFASGIITGQPKTVYVRLKAGLTNASSPYNGEIISNAGGGATTVNVTCDGTVTPVPSPTLTSSTSTLTGFSYNQGAGPSANQTFTISGVALTGSGNITVTGSTNYEVSTDGATYASSITYPYASGVITGQPKTVYVRLKAGLLAGNYNSENVAISGGSAATINVTCNGTVSSGSTPEPITPCVTDWVAADWTYNAVSGTTTIYSLQNTSYIISPAMNFDLYTGETLNFKARTNGGVNAAKNTITVSISTNNGSSWTVLGTRVPLNTTLTAMTAFDLSSFSGTQVKIKFETLGADGTVGVQMDDICIEGSVICVTPTTQASGITFSNVSAYGMQISWTNGNGLKRAVFVKETSGAITNPSNSTTYTASSDWSAKGTQLGTSGYYCVYNGTGTTVTLTNLVSNTPYYVQVFEYGCSTGNEMYYTATAANNPNNQTTLVANPTLTLSTTTLSSLDYNLGSGPSVAQSFTISGVDLTAGPITITAPANFLVCSTLGGTYVSSYNITYTAPTLASTTVYVKLAGGLAVGAYSGNIACSGGSATTVNVALSGSVVPLSSITITEAGPLTIASICNASGIYAAPQIFHVTGDYLTANMTIGFSFTSSKIQISTDNVTYYTAAGSATITIVPVANSVNETVYIRTQGGFGTATGATATVTCASTGATSKTINAVYTINALPSLATLSADVTTAEGTSASFNISTAGLTYQWQQQEAFPSTTWVDLAGATSQTVTLPAVSYEMNQYKYRLYASNGTCTDTTSSRTLTVTTSGTITSCGAQGFAGGTTPPSGFTFTNINTTDAANFGLATPALLMDATNDRVISGPVTAPTVMSFFIKGLGTMTGSSLLVEGYNGYSWQTIENITTIPTVSTTKTYTSGSHSINNYSKFRFTFTKGGGSANMVFDDVDITCGTVTSAWILDEKFDNITSLADINSGLTNTPGFTASETGGGIITGEAIAARFNRGGYSLKFTGTVGSTITITTPTFANADLLSFYWSYPGNGDLLIEKSTTAKASWVTLTTIPTSPSYGRVYFIALTTDIVRLRFSYTRGSSGYAYIDDIRIRSASSGSTTDLKILQTLIQSCSGGEGTNESVIFKTGVNPIKVSDLSISFPNTGAGGNEYSMEAQQKFTNSPAYITSLNNFVHLTYPACTPVIVPPSGIIPANSYAVIFTGRSPSVLYDFKFACPAGITYYAIFCDNTNTVGRYGNAPAVGELCYTSIIDKKTGTFDTQFYDDGVPNSAGALAEYDETSRARTYKTNNCEMILPIKLVSFKAQCVERNVQLSWITASEINNDYFILEKSTDLIDWDKVAVINGSGNSNENITYVYYDLNESNKAVYYRLKQKDYNGEITEFDPIFVTCDNSFSDMFLLFPNPVSSKLSCEVFYSNDFAQINELSLAEIQVYNSFGMVVYAASQDLNQGLNKFEFDISKLSSGVYFFKIYSKDGKINRFEKFVKH